MNLPLKNESFNKGRFFYQNMKKVIKKMFIIKWHLKYFMLKLHSKIWNKKENKKRIRNEEEMKKIILLISLISVLASCGGGGGGSAP